MGGASNNEVLPPSFYEVHRLAFSRSEQGLSVLRRAEQQKHLEERDTGRMYTINREHCDGDAEQEREGDYKQLGRVGIIHANEAVE